MVWDLIALLWPVAACSRTIDLLQMEVLVKAPHQLQAAAPPALPAHIQAMLHSSAQSVPPQPLHAAHPSLAPPAGQPGHVGQQGQPAAQGAEKLPTQKPSPWPEQVSQLLRSTSARPAEAPAAEVRPPLIPRTSNGDHKRAGRAGCAGGHSTEAVGAVDQASISAHMFVSSACVACLHLND